MDGRHESIQELKNYPQIGPQLSVDERLKILASLIVERILEKERGFIKNPYEKPEFNH